MALIDNLVSYWKLDEASGDAIDIHGPNDLIANGFSGNTPDTATGVLSNSRDFERDTEEYFYISDASQSGLDFGDEDFSISAWIKTESSLTAPRGIVAKGQQEGLGYWLGFGADDTPAFRVATLSASGQATWGASVSTGSWRHVVGVHDSAANEVRIYVDNGSAVTTAYSSGCDVSSKDFDMGRIFWNTAAAYRYWDGLIDEVGVWARALTAGDVSDLYNGGAGLAYPFTTPKGIILPRRHRRIANLVRM